MENINERRARFDTLGKNYPKAATIKTEQVFIGHVNCYWLTPTDPSPGKIIIWLHGGAFAVGSIRSHEAMLSHFSVTLNTSILFVDYSLAPEHPYPAANNDVLAVYKALVESHPGYAISFIGDSCGGGLIVAAVGDMMRQHIPLPKAAILISPWISLDCDNPSHEENRSRDVVLTREYAKASAKDYTGNTPFAISSPENIALSQFPPVLMMVGSNEILLDDSTNFYKYIKPIQQNAVLSIYNGQNHVWPLANINSDASQKALAEAEGFLKDI